METGEGDEIMKKGDMKVKEGKKDVGQREKKGVVRGIEGEPEWYKDHMANVVPI